MGSPEAHGMRDLFMARNVLWILSQEEKRGNRCVFVSAHNGHIEQMGAYGPEQKVMGNLLADELGESYYAIGTDFFEWHQLGTSLALAMPRRQSGETTSRQPSHAICVSVACALPYQDRAA